MDWIKKWIKTHIKRVWLFVLSALVLFTALSGAWVIQTVTSILAIVVWLAYVQENYGDWFMNFAARKEVPHGEPEPSDGNPDDQD